VPIGSMQWMNCVEGSDSKGCACSFSATAMAMFDRRWSITGERSLCQSDEEFVAMRKSDSSRYNTNLSRARVVQRTARPWPGKFIQCYQSNRSVGKMRWSTAASCCVCSRPIRCTIVKWAIAKGLVSLLAFYWCMYVRLWCEWLTSNWFLTD
jgi:hypothetical protein